MAATHDHILSFCVQQKHFILLFFCPLHWSSSRPGFFLFCFFCLSSSSSSASFIFWAGLHKQLQKHQGLACIICVEFLFRAASVWEQPFGERPQLWIMGWDWGLVLFELSFSNKPKPFKLFFNFFFFLWGAWLTLNDPHVRQEQIINSSARFSKNLFTGFLPRLFGAHPAKTLLLAFFHSALSPPSLSNQWRFIPVWWWLIRPVPSLLASSDLLSVGEGIVEELE